MATAGTDSATMQDLADKAQDTARYLAELTNPTSSMSEAEYVAWDEAEQAPPLSGHQIATLSALLTAVEAVARKRGT
ncbi:MAG: hypothetical protein ACLQGN_30850 [Mycobacterium sp.]|uniref:hypothetical protein n=1 Tax=Mycobacterium sp. TaxID=1785 RepID=UPI003F9B8447